MRYVISAGAALLAFAGCLPVAAQTPPHTVTVQIPAKTSQTAEDAQVAEVMAALFKAEPLTAEQEARLPLAKQVVSAMTPDGFYADIMDEMMSGMLQPLFDMVGEHGMAEEALRRQVGIEAENQPELSEEQRAQVLALLDPAAKERAAAVMTGLTGLIKELGRQIEAPFRDGFSKAFAVRFTEAELRDTQRFFATPSGASFARQSVALYSDPQVMGAMMSMMPKMLEGIPQLTADVEQATANLPKQRGYADLSPAERQKLARLLGMTEGQLRQAMNKAEQAREDEQPED